MEEYKGIEVKRVCEKCGEINDVNSSTIKIEVAHTKYGNNMRLIYYTCKRCNENHVLQIDTKESLDIFNELKQMTIETAKKRMKGKEVSKKVIRKKDRLIKELNLLRLKANECFNGMTLYDKNEKVIINQLTLPKVGDIIDSVQ